MFTKLNLRYSLPRLPSLVSNLKIKHMLLIGFMILILFGAIGALIIGPRLITHNMEGQISDRIDEILNITTNALNDTKRDISLYANLFSYDQSIEQSMNWRSERDKQIKMLHIVSTLSRLTRETQNKYHLAVEIIPKKGLLNDKDTIKAVVEWQSFHYADQTIIDDVQHSIENQEIANSAYLKINHGILTMVAISRISEIIHDTSDIRTGRYIGAVAVAATLDNNFIGSLQQKISSDIHLTVYMLNPKNHTAKSVATTICDADGKAVVNRSLSKTTVQDIIKADNNDKYNFRNATIDHNPFRIVYKVLADKNGNHIGLLEIAVPTERIVAATANTKKQISIMAIVGIIISLLVVWWILHNINSPLSSLIQGTEIIAQGNFQQRIGISARNELGFLAEKFNWMTENIEKQQTELVQKEKLAAIGNFTSSIVHDLKNPLSTVLWYAKLLMKDEFPEEEKMECAQFIIDEINRLSEMTQEVLEFSKGTIKLDKKPCQLSDLMKDIFTFLTGALKENNIEVNLQQNFSGKIEIDAEKIRKVIYNLAVNARDAMPSGGKLTIATSCENNIARIDVTDTGKGIPEDIMKNLFQPFFTYGKANGIGLGLSICQKIIEEHKGSITVESKENVGTTFRIYLPI